MSLPPCKYNVFYNAGIGSGFRQLPPSTSQYLLGSGFELLADRLSEMGYNLWTRPASRQAVAALSTIQINALGSECAVCIEALTIGSEALQMPCKHIYHSHCIITWLNEHSSCPICREMLPTQMLPDLSIWRLPCDGFAVGRFVGRGDEEPPDGIGVVFMPQTRLPRGGGILRNFFGNMGRCLGRAREY